MRNVLNTTGISLLIAPVIYFLLAFIEIALLGGDTLAIQAMTLLVNNTIQSALPICLYAITAIGFAEIDRTYTHRRHTMYNRLIAKLERNRHQHILTLSDWYSTLAEWIHEIDIELLNAGNKDSVTKEIERFKAANRRFNRSENWLDIKTLLLNKLTRR